MESLFIALASGLAGGLVLALIIAKAPRKLPPHVVARRLAVPSTAVINMAAIRVEGVGGLGMVAAVMLVAVVDPRIRLAIIAALVMGVAMALVLIASRRGTGALPSGGGSPDDRSMLRLEGRRSDNPTPSGPQPRPASSRLAAAIGKRPAVGIRNCRAGFPRVLPTFLQ